MSSLHLSSYFFPEFRVNCLSVLPEQEPKALLFLRVFLSGSFSSVKGVHLKGLCELELQSPLH